MTAAVSPSRAHRSAATALSTPPLMATSVRPGGGSGTTARVAGRGTQRAGQRVGGELGGVQLARAETAQLGGDLPRPDPGRVEAPAAPRASVTAALPAAVAAPQPCGVEAGVGHAVAVDGDRELDLVAAGDAPDGGGERAVGRRRWPCGEVR